MYPSKERSTRQRRGPLPSSYRHMRVIDIFLSGLLIALTYIGGELAQLMLGLPGASIQLFQGMLLFFLLATDLFANYKVKIGADN